MRKIFYCILFFKLLTPLPPNNNRAQFFTMVVCHDWAVGEGFAFVKYRDHLRKNVRYRRWTIRKIRPDAFIIRCLVYIIIFAAWQLYGKRRRRKRISRQSAAYDNGRTNCDRLECVLRVQLSKSNIFADDCNYGEPSTTTDRYNIIIRYTRLCVYVRERQRWVQESEKFEYGDGDRTFETTLSTSNVPAAKGSSFIVPSECILPRTNRRPYTRIIRMCTVHSAILRYDLIFRARYYTGTKTRKKYK